MHVLFVGRCAVSLRANTVKAWREPIDLCSGEMAVRESWAIVSLRSGDAWIVVIDLRLSGADRQCSKDGPRVVSGKRGKKS